MTAGALVCQAEADGLGSHCHQSLCVSFTGSLQRVRGSPGNSGTILMRKCMTCTTPESRAVRGSCFKVYRVFLVAVETGGAVLALGGGGRGSWTSRDHGHPHTLEDFSRPTRHPTRHSDDLVDALGGENWFPFVGSRRHCPSPPTYGVLSGDLVDTTGQGQAAAGQRDVAVCVTGNAVLLLGPVPEGCSWDPAVAFRVLGTHGHSTWPAGWPWRLAPGRKAPGGVSASGVVG